MTKLYAYSNAVDYPSTLNLTAYFKDFAGLAWVGQASAGNSASHSFGSHSASIGASFRSHPSADLDGTSDYLGTGSYASSELISTSALTLDWIAQFDTASASDSINPDNEPGIFVDFANGNFRVTYSTSGVRAAIYPSGTTSYVALATGTKACIQCVYDGTTLKIRVNGGSWASVSSSNIVGLTGVPTLGVNYNATKHIDGRFARFISSNTAISSTELDGLYADAQNNYGV